MDVLHKCYESTDLEHLALAPSFDIAFHFMKMPVYFFDIPLLTTFYWFQFVAILN